MGIRRSIRKYGGIGGSALGGAAALALGNDPAAGGRIGGILGSVASATLGADDEMHGDGVGAVLNKYNQKGSGFVNRKESRKHRRSRLALRALSNRLLNINTKTQKFIIAKTPGVLVGNISAQGFHWIEPLASFIGNTNYEDLNLVRNAMPFPIATGDNWPGGNTFADKIRFTSAYQTVELTNSSVLCYVDIYKYVTVSEIDSATPDAMSTTAPGKWDGGTVVSASTIGVTPFDFQPFVN